jgi:hypothetical protein
MAVATGRMLVQLNTLAACSALRIINASIVTFAPFSTGLGNLAIQRQAANIMAGKMKSGIGHIGQSRSMGRMPRPVEYAAEPTTYKMIRLNMLSPMPTTQVSNIVGVVLGLLLVMASSILLPSCSHKHFAARSA